MSLLSYIRRVLVKYASGDEEYLSTILDPVSSPYDDLDELIDEVEKRTVAVGELLAGSRMATTPGGVNSESEGNWVEGVNQLNRSLDETLSRMFPGDLSVKSKLTKSDLIEVGILQLVIKRLEGGIDRISRLNVLSIALPEKLKHVQIMFSEAHLNFLLGNRHAVATICRALVEVALKERLLPEKSGSLYDCINEARDKGILDPERTICARKIKTAGDMAAHGDPGLSKYHDEQIEELLINTRKILEDFYCTESD